MEVTPTLFLGNLHGSFDDANDEPIRAEIFSVERLELYAHALAAEHKNTSLPKRSLLLLPRLEENSKRLVRVYRSLADAISKERIISPASEWLVDNFHIVEEQLREIREDLPRGYYKELPKLSQERVNGFPRIYVIALALIAHTDSRLDSDLMGRFIRAYQQVTPLTIGETWAIAITLRLALVENLSRLSSRMMQSRVEREAADDLADWLLDLATNSPDSVMPEVIDRLSKRSQLSRAFVVQLSQRLREQDPVVGGVIEWLEKRLEKRSETIEQLVHIEHQSQAAAQATVGNIITSMRLLSTIDWRDFFESVSLVDPVLGEDPTGAYAKMDFATRDRYRHVIERISKRTENDELTVAKSVVKLAVDAAESRQNNSAETHVGYYLVDQGLQELESEFKYRAPLVEGIKRLILRHATTAYLGSITIITCLIIALLVFYAWYAGAGLFILILFGLLSIVPSSDLAVSILNWDLTHLFEPRLLPKMDTSHGITDDSRTMVVIPTLFTSDEAIIELLERLEVQFLANQDKNIYFALLGDFTDAPTEELPVDSTLLDTAMDGIEQLNARHSADGQARFHLFHRRRLWNEREGKWMGWERKRGKLSEFNSLIRGERDTSFIIATADLDLLSGVRFVITLDSDTQLPRDVARKLVGITTHPLNRPVFDRSLGRIKRGYGILQPRVGISLESASQSRFSRLFSGQIGLDPYTTAASDIYQDLFAEGSFTGKGLYDVEAFEGALAGRVPENSLLSHDLFEGLFARCGLVTDVELLDDFPARYDSYAKRQHRWVRGDWQIARWLFPLLPDANGNRVRNRLPLISRWKIFDNLRRSMVAPSLILWLLAVWTIIPGALHWWMLFLVAMLAFPVFAHATTNLLVHPRGIALKNHFWSVLKDARINTAQTAFAIMSIAHQAYLDVDAIARTLFRKIVSGKHLLEWTSAAQVEKSGSNGLAAFVRFMSSAQVLSFLIGLILLSLRPSALAIAAPFLIAWFASPFIAFWLSRPLERKQVVLTKQETAVASLTARRTWRYFETFVTAEDNWLPPDNFQEDPQPVIAHRTSPTNIGLLLLSTVAAHDFGYVGTLELVERLEMAFASLARLQRYRGHFLNWYDTRSLEQLNPQYVSTVDSGNLAGTLLALKQSLIELPDTRLFDRRVLDGMSATLQLLSEEASRLSVIRQRTEALTVSQLREELQACKGLLSAEMPESLAGWATLFQSLSHHMDALEDIIAALSHEHGGPAFAELAFWAGALTHEMHVYRRDLDMLMTWVPMRDITLAESASSLPNELATRWVQIAASLNSVTSLGEIPNACDLALTDLAALHADVQEWIAEDRPNRASLLTELETITQAIERTALTSNETLSRISKLAQLCEHYFDEMDFTLLLDPERKVFAIGCRLAEGKLDNSFYDLLASEARLASFIAIAKGDARQEHWFRMSRPTTAVDGSRALVSWTATMFEYLMPLLLMRSFPETLLSQTYEAIVERQIEYGAEHNVPWGVSESAYNARDLHLNYQYGPFGVPGLGLKRGLAEDLVVSPYSTMLAALIRPHEALANLRKLESKGALAQYGFYEAIDFTPERLQEGQDCAIIRAFMSHHQGMIMLALDNLLNQECMQRRFHSEPLVQATELLLQERIPRGVSDARPPSVEVLSSRIVRTPAGRVTRSYGLKDLDLPTPRVQLLSNGDYSVMMTVAGSGYSNCTPYAMTRWREDATQDDWGSFIYLRDVRSGVVWSAGYQPTRRKPQSYRVAFSEDKVEISRLDNGIMTRTEIIVSSEDDAEIRRVTLTNKSSRVRDIEVTSYAEVVLVTPDADAAHPAFSNLFIETEFLAAEDSLCARRRPRSPEDEPVWAIHTLAAETEKTVGSLQYETDRARFLGRGRNPSAPVAVMEDRPLSNTVGAVLDPVFSLRRRVRLLPGQNAHVTFSTAIARSHEEAIRLASKHRNPHNFKREAGLAWTRAQVDMRHLNVDAEQAHLFQRLAARVVFSDPSLRPRPHVLALNSKSQSGLWAYGISGDIPIVLVRINRGEHLQTVRELLHAHEYLRLKGLAFDLVILNDHPPSYIQGLHDEIRMLIRTTGSHALEDKPGGIFLRRTDTMPEADRILLHSVARAVIVAERGSLDDQLVRRPAEEDMPPTLVPRWSSQNYPELAVPRPELLFFNGLGGFSQDGKEYITVLGEGQSTPAPWSNVIANAHDFGFQVSETGGGYTWSVNSRENRLTPWNNDAVSDPPGEAIYLRDEDTGTVWTPTPLPIREAQPYVIRHGHGYSIFEHTSHGIAQELLMFVPLDSHVKISLLRLTNRTDRTRKISVTPYAELTLGTRRDKSAPYIITDIDKATGSIFARNPYNTEFADRVAFLNISERQRTWTCDRKEFLGRHGTYSKPAALGRVALSNHYGAGRDPCAAMQAQIELLPGDVRTIVVLLGEAATANEARDVVNMYGQLSESENAFELVKNYWEEALTALVVKTPDPALDMIVNRWLLYQTLACRIWARSAFYQSGGAFGFRDQLQDVMALVFSQPEIARSHILLASSRQFREGDVQHWWNPPTGHGVRTRFSDDLLWLPFVTCFYVTATGDQSILDEDMPFVEAPLLATGEDESYTRPTVTHDTATLYDHCRRAIEKSLAVGEHGLPLMGSGDWNDGMNRVGNKGKGESVWVGWFLYTTLAQFSRICDTRQDSSLADFYRVHMEKLRTSLEENAWDGDWYRRAYFDDGTPLGSAQNDECRIDSIVQSWGVISGAADPHRAARAMAAVEEYLVSRGDGIVILFTPPFDKSALNPGYIKGYVPGVRENGGQYTHAAIWTLIAFAMLGDGDRAGELFTLLNPINHSSTRAGLHKYKVEPYVAAADVYAGWPHTGRGGWTWYTGSAGWMYRAALESILGFNLMGNVVRLNPCIPRSWPEFEIQFRNGSTQYVIKVENPLGVSNGIAEAWVDEQPLHDAEFALVSDGNTHNVRVVLGTKQVESEAHHDVTHADVTEQQQR